MTDPVVITFADPAGVFLIVISIALISVALWEMIRR